LGADVSARHLLTGGFETDLREILWTKAWGELTKGRKTLLFVEPQKISGDVRKKKEIYEPFIPAYSKILIMDLLNQ
jgi:hypothetical protein